MKKKKFSEAFEVAKALLESLPVPKNGTSFEKLFYPPLWREDLSCGVVSLALVVGCCSGMFIGEAFNLIFASIIGGGVTFFFIALVILQSLSDDWRKKNPTHFKVYEIYKILIAEEQKKFKSIFHKSILEKAQNVLLKKKAEEEYV